MGTNIGVKQYGGMDIGVKQKSPVYTATSSISIVAVMAAAGQEVEASTEYNGDLSSVISAVIQTAGSVVYQADQNSQLNVNLAAGGNYIVVCNASISLSTQLSAVGKIGYRGNLSTGLFAEIVASGKVVYQGDLSAQVGVSSVSSGDYGYVGRQESSITSVMSSFGNVGITGNQVSNLEIQVGALGSYVINCDASVAIVTGMSAYGRVGISGNLSSELSVNVAATCGYLIVCDASVFISTSVSGVGKYALEGASVMNLSAGMQSNGNYIPTEEYFADANMNLQFNLSGGASYAINGNGNINFNINLAATGTTFEAVGGTGNMITRLYLSGTGEMTGGLPFGFPAGTNYYVPVTVNKEKTFITAEHFVYEIDFSSVLASDSVFKSFIGTKENVAVYDPITSFVRPKIADLDLANDKLLIQFDAPVDAENDRVFYVCVGLSVNQDNSDSVYANSHYSNRWGMNEFTGSTVEDTAGTINGTIVSPAELTAGKFGNGVSINSGAGRITLDDIVSLSNVSKFTVEFMFNKLDNTENSIIFRKISSSTSGIFIDTNSSNMRFSVNNTSASVALMSLTGVEEGEWHHVVMVYDGTQITDATKLKVYLDSVMQTLTVQNTPFPATTSDLTGVANTIGYSSTSFDGSLDEFGIMTDAKTLEWAVTRYNLFFDSVYYSEGTGSMINSPYSRVMSGLCITL